MATVPVRMTASDGVFRSHEFARLRPNVRTNSTHCDTAAFCRCRAGASPVDSRRGAGLTLSRALCLTSLIQGLVVIRTLMFLAVAAGMAVGLWRFWPSPALAPSAMTAPQKTGVQPTRETASTAESVSASLVAEVPLVTAAVEAVDGIPSGTAQSTVTQASAETSPNETTAPFDSSEPLPPGVEFPEGPQILQTADASPSRIGPVAPPRLLSTNARPLEPLAATAESEFAPLLMGDDLAGWVAQDGKPEAWSLAEDVLRCNRATGGWLRTEQEYSDFELLFDVRLSAGANTGVAFRFPAEGSPTIGGFEIQLIDDSAAKYTDLRPDQRTGSVYYQMPPLQECRLPVNAWAAVRLLVLGSRIRVEIDGVVVNEVDLNQLPAGEAQHPLRSRPPVGHVGFQSSAQAVEFRNIRMHDLATRHESGLALVDLEVGAGEVCPAGARVNVEYSGRLTDGREFDSSYERGEPVTLPLTAVIPGWQAGIPGMRVGGRRKLVVPAALAYGDAGVKDLIPPGATLVFEVELRGIER